MRKNHSWNTNTNLIRRFSSSTDEFYLENGPTTSTNFALDPYSAEAKATTKALGITQEQHEKLTQLSHLVVEWNERLNLISRKDCNVDVVFGRHVLPSVALAALPQFQNLVEKCSNPRIVDVGTGGGFPGVPLSILYPEANFFLVDSVGKKLKAINEMATELELDNIVTHHGRAEEIADDPIIGRKHKRKYDICVGRSVTAMPKFCFWIQDLLKGKEGNLVYIIGGEGKYTHTYTYKCNHLIHSCSVLNQISRVKFQIVVNEVEESVQSRVEIDVEIDDLLKCPGASDKRTLVLSSKDVIAVAKESGEKKNVRKNKSNNKKTGARRQNDDGEWKKSKGGWTEKNNAVKKERGYSNFKRYDFD